MLFHRLYGLLLATNRALPSLPLLSDPGCRADVQICLKHQGYPFSLSRGRSESIYESPAKDEAGDPVLRAAMPVGSNYLELSYCDGANFAIDLRGNEVFVDWPDSLTVEDVAPYLVGPVLGVVLRLRGMVPLHASAVAIADHAVALAGPAGAGKSTTAAAFATCGYRVISDDVVVLREEGSGFVVPPGYPRVNLWSASVQAISGKAGTLPRICPTLDKHFMPLDPATQFETTSLPLGGIFVLQMRQPGLVAPKVRPLTGTEAFVAILGNTYVNYLPDPEGRRREFELLARVVRRVPIRGIQAGADLSMLAELTAVIAADVEARGSSLPAESI
jgi:hypothetical protein